ncbi:MAG: DUF1987 domain-containing protein [Rhodocyclaceae bacterium]|nr:DUF1987 domain-containing protein [Rhodocyclaceae bacterium]
MSSLKIPGSTRTPEIDFNFETGEFSMAGESYPEDVRAFYDEPVRQFVGWLGSSDTPVNFDFRLVYFNSSSARVLVGLIDQIEDAARDGRACRIRWHHAADDENIRELGEEFGSDLSATRFELVVLE